jgi:hypothetical protein
MIIFPCSKYVLVPVNPFSVMFQFSFCELTLANMYIWKTEINYI